MSELVDELRSARERTAQAERDLHEARFKAAVTCEACDRSIDVAAALEILVPEMFVLDWEGNPLNVRQVFDLNDAYLRLLSEKRAAAQEPRSRVGEVPVRRSVRMAHMVSQSRRTASGSWVA